MTPGQYRRSGTIGEQTSGAEMHEARMVKKLVSVAALSQNCSSHVDDKSGPGGLLPGEIPGILNIC